MKTLYKEFNCPQCGGLRYIYVNGICFDCCNENTLATLTERRKMQLKLSNSFRTLSVESYN